MYIKKSKTNNSTGKLEFKKEKFIYIPADDKYICTENKELIFSEYSSKNDVKYKRYKCKEYNECGSRNNCTTSKSGRNIQRWIHEDILEDVESETAKNLEIYKKRKTIVEHPFGTIKRNLDYTYFNRCGLDSVNAGAASIFVAYNLKRIINILTVSVIIEKLKQLG